MENSQLTQRFANKTALVTGGARGIGKAIALRLAAEGAMIAVGYRENVQAAQEVVNSIIDHGGQAMSVQGDVRVEKSVDTMVNNALNHMGQLDILVNNAGVEHERPLQDITEHEWDDTFAVNVKGAFFCSRAAATIMLKNKGGVIINISSRFGFLGDPTSLPYGASKAALNNLTKALAKQYAPHIRVNGVAPAYTPTDMMVHVDQTYIDNFSKNTPLNRPTSVEDTAAAVAFLASEDASFSTGVTLLVDGGYHLK